MLQLREPQQVGPSAGVCRRSAWNDCLDRQPIAARGGDCLGRAEYGRTNHNSKLDAR